jgi:hypothetical protein
MDGARRLLPGPVIGFVDNGIQLRIDRFDLANRIFDQLGCRHLFAADKVGQPYGIIGCELGGRAPRSLRTQARLAMLWPMPAQLKLAADVVMKSLRLICICASKVLKHASAI